MIIEVDETPIHEAKLNALEGVGARARCQVRRQSVIVDGALGSDQLCDAIESALNCEKPALFILDSSLTSWPENSYLHAVTSAARLAAEGSIIVGPAPETDVAPQLHQAG